MNRFRVAILMALLVCPAIIQAHEVPDHVRISVLLKPTPGRMQILVRMPANALIDFLLPTLSEGNWLDLANADELATAGAKVWIADLLPISANGVALPRPDLVKIRISRVNDPSFTTFENAWARVTGARLPADTLVTQDQVTVDALLELPIASVDGDFSLEPRFGRLGVLVDTTTTFLPAGGGIRQFQYEGDPEPFALDPGAGHAVARFVRAGFAQYFSDTDYLLFALCIALVFRRIRFLPGFTVTLAGAESLVLLASLTLLPSLPWLRAVCGVLIAAATVYIGIEAIIAGDGQRTGLAIAGGLILGGSFWIALQPVIQFAGTHRLVAGLGFNIGLLAAELVTLALLVGATQLMPRLSRAPRATVVIAAAVAIHVSWRRMLERADALALIPASLPGGSPATLYWIGAIIIAVLVGSAYYLGRKKQVRAAAAAV